MKNLGVMSVLLPTLVLTSLSAGEAQVRPLVFVGDIAWVDPPNRLPTNVTHGTFRSTSMDVEVGYSIYLPPGYEEGVGRYPVVYWLHGAVGSERGTRPAEALHSVIADGRVEPMVLVVANGGRRSGFIDKSATILPTQPAGPPAGRPSSPDARG